MAPKPGQSKVDIFCPFKVKMQVAGIGLRSE